MSAGHLYALAENLLDAATGALVEATTGHAPPGAAFVTYSPPAPDFCCDDGQVTVHLAGLSHEPFGRNFGTNPPAQSCAVTPTPTFHITLMRCVPTMDEAAGSPSATAIDDHAESLLGDLWALLTELYDRRDAETLFSIPVQCADVEIGEVEPHPAEGGCGGWVIPVSVVANDSGPTGS